MKIVDIIGVLVYVLMGLNEFYYLVELVDLFYIEEVFIKYVGNWILVLIYECVVEGLVSLYGNGYLVKGIEYVEGKKMLVGLIIMVIVEV